ncbi:hypothetical protein SPRG_01689 [Saprolegnia parasitica CBS 223.65]|uniref:AAA+ ATPase domain-containing protein n=1 Tax=Saprolegnia parasitica (strain CBS 223.65) TaxID=695850 RepID=A0A067CX36_SAPPC|nr:hypothetical protein SPRG_01689 [Saprolegnia parasitica CBS 223.65]KDO33810.1 hypothetical protein SPRG_01689 [Saprolegnia parasitica CBS 223.65]|eukprot:XP_012195446.1 hypothetical protein SPRG_01689 [Saprolegnia parasitica CBS 223.65]
MSRQGALVPLYKRLVGAKKLRPDAAQEAVVGHLQKLQKRLTSYELPSSEHGAMQVPRGLYLVGKVGTGKSMLMDLFYESLETKKRRVHFNAFLLEVHRRIHARKQEHLATFGRSAHIELEPERDIITLIAKEVAQESPVLCFDEFQVIDIADAMIMRKFFGTLFNQGTVMIATSNTHPKDLYPDGVNREYFLPFLDLLQQHTRVVSIDSSTDHRRIEKPVGETYVHPWSASADASLKAAAEAMLPKGASLSLQTTPVMMGRSLTVLGYRDVVCVASFQELCNTEKGAADYKALAEAYGTVVLLNVPQLTIQMHNQARRFITLLDELYEHRVRLLCSAHVMPDDLFAFNGAPKPQRLSPEEVDALRKANQAAGVPAFSSWDGPSGAFENDPSNENPVKNMSSMTDLLYACNRAVSRLHEMRTATYQTRAQR